MVKIKEILKQYSILLSDSDVVYVDKIAKSLEYSRSKMIRTFIRITQKIKRDDSKHETVKNIVQGKDSKTD